ncbi:MAG TPA: serine hydrolase, partial [Candidatus Nitrosotenuis sp.]|nr:serine hydrolase [Candidatus Nitrosotenuis sp.]
FTIRDLLCHRSGLPGYSLDTLLELSWSPDEVLPVLHKIPLKHPFRQAYDYQNIFPGIAGIIIEKVTGKPLSQVYDDYIFKPLNLQETTIGKCGLTGGESWIDWLKAKWRFWQMDKTDEHHPIDGKAVVIQGHNPTIYKFEASRGVNSSAEDLAQWMIFLLNDGKVSGQTLVSRDQFMETRTPHIKVGPPKGGRLFPKDRVPDIDYGLGWFIHPYDRLNLLSHMGGMTGTRSLIALCPEEKLGIVIISNMGGMRVSLFPEAIRSKFFDMYLNLTDERDWSKDLITEFKISRSELEKSRQNHRLKNPMPAQENSFYTGVYENDLYGKLEIVEDKGQLFIKYRSLDLTPLTHWNGDNFTFKGYELTPAYSGNDLGEISFGNNGQVSQSYGLAINLFHEGKDTIFKRVK